MLNHTRVLTSIVAVYHGSNGRAWGTGAHEPARLGRLERRRAGPNTYWSGLPGVPPPGATCFRNRKRALSTPQGPHGPDGRKGGPSGDATELMPGTPGGRSRTEPQVNWARLAVGRDNLQPAVFQNHPAMQPRAATELTPQREGRWGLSHTIGPPTVRCHLGRARTLVWFLSSLMTIAFWCDVYGSTS